MKLFAPLIVLSVVLVEMSNGYDILFLAPMGSKSHKNFYNGIINSLADKGHKLTVVTSFKSKKHANIEDVIMPEEYSLLRHMPNVFKDSGLTPVFRLIEFAPKVCAESIKIKDVQDLLKRKFDLILISSLMGDCYYSIVHQLQTPYISVLPAGLISSAAYMMGNPHFPSITPDIFFDMTPPLSFFERFKVVVGTFFMNFMINTVMDSRFDSYCRSSGACPSDMPLLFDIKANSSAIIINSIRTLETAVQPYMPNIIHGGGIHLKPSEPLPNDLLKWADESGDDGFIFFSLGSATIPSDMPDNYRKTLLKTFGSLKQKVLWKWNEDHMDDLPDNVKLGKWLPQQDIFGHPKLKLFITHGGLHSIQESIYHGVKIVGLPLFADQIYNLKQAENQGWGRVLRWTDLTVESLTSLINEVIDNKKMEVLVKKRASLMMDQIRPPQDDVTYWIEYIIRHNGAEHLKSPLIHMTWYELYNVDIYILLLGIMSVSSVIMFLMTRCCCRFMYRRCCKSKSSKRKKE